MLDASGVTDAQMTQVLTSAEQMAPGQPLQSANVEEMLRSMAQTYHVRTAGGQRQRLALAALPGQEEEEEAHRGFLSLLDSQELIAAVVVAVEHGRAGEGPQVCNDGTATTIIN